MLGYVYTALCIYWIIVLYKCKEFIIRLHYLLLISLIFNCLQSFVGYAEKCRANQGEHIAGNTMFIALTGISISFNLCILVLLSLGYGISDCFYKQYPKIFVLCVTYFVVWIVPLMVDTKKLYLTETRYNLFIYFFGFIIAGLAGYGFCRSCMHFSDRSQQFNFV